MKRLGFSAKHFAIFDIDGFQPRMEALKEHVRPRLEQLGHELGAALHAATGDDFHPHVAKHQRRTVHPPPETWVALGPSPRGYKRYGYLALVISSHGLHTRVVVKQEADLRAKMATNFRKQSGALRSHFNGAPLRRYDRWDFHAIPEPVAADKHLWETCASALKKKTGGIDLGVAWEKRQAAKLDIESVVERMLDLMPLYRMTRV